MDAAVHASPTDAASFVRALPLSFAADALTWSTPAAMAAILEKSAALDGGVKLETTATLATAVSPQVAAAAIEQLTSGVAAGICDEIPVEFLARAVASMSATRGGAVVARLSKVSFAAQVMSLVDPLMHAAAVLSAMKPNDAARILCAIVASSPKVALDVIAASLAPKKMAAIVDAAVLTADTTPGAEASASASAIAAAVFWIGDAKRREHDPKVAAVLSLATPEAAGAVLCAGASAGDADRAAAVAALMDPPSNSLALAAAGAAGAAGVAGAATATTESSRHLYSLSSRHLVSLVLSAMPVEDAAKLISRAPHAVAAEILASYPPNVAVSLIATGAVDARAAEAGSTTSTHSDVVFIRSPPSICI